MLHTTQLSLCSKRFPKQICVFGWNTVTKNHSIIPLIPVPRQRVSSQAAVCLSYDVYGYSREQNRGSPLVIMHGMFGSKRNWATFCKGYNKMTGRQVIAADLRNHGDSRHCSEMTFQLMAYDIEKLLVELNIPKAILIGHSLGGKVVIEMALNRPSCVEKLVVVDVNHATKFERIREFQVVIQAMLDVNLARVQSRKEVDDILAKTIALPGLRAFLLTNLKTDEYNNFAWRLNLTGILKNVKSLTEGVALHGREEYDGETMFVAGGNSTYVRKEDLPAIREMFPRAQLDVVPDAGHLVHVDKPKEFLNVVHDFVESKMST